MRNSTKHLWSFGEGHHFSSVVGLNSPGLCLRLWTAQNPTWTFHFSLFSLFSLLHRKGVVNSSSQREESELGSAQGNSWPEALIIQVFYWHQGLISCNWIMWEVLHCPGVTLALLWITRLSVIRVFLQPTPIQLQALTEIKEEEFRFQLAYLLGKCFFYS